MEQSEWPIINDKYIVHMKIASGIQGSVVLATNKETRVRYAIKIYKQKRQKDYFDKYIKIEMEKLQASMSSEYIIKLEEILVDASYVKPDNTSTTINAIVMEYAPFGNFHDFIYLTGTFTELAAKYYFRQLILGINYLHNEQNICHRDLKPENLLLNANYEMRICDLALCAQLNTALTTQVGCLQFQAPETHFQNGYNGRAADIFSAGVILFLMLIGSYPFLNTKTYQDSTLLKYWAMRRTKSLEEPQQEHALSQTTNTSSSLTSSLNNNNNNQQKKPMAGQGISDKAIDLITQMLQKDPLNRISLAEIIGHPWLAEEVNKEEVITQMKDKIAIYQKETKAEYRNAIKRCGGENKQPQNHTSNACSMNSNGAPIKQSISITYEHQQQNKKVFDGFQKFRSDSANFQQKQAQDGVEQYLQLDKKKRSYKVYDKLETGIHDFEFESKSESANCDAEIKEIYQLLHADPTIKNLKIDERFYKFGFNVTDANGNISEVKISIKANSERQDHFLMTLTKNNGVKSLGLEIYQRIKGLLLN